MRREVDCGGDLAGVSAHGDGDRMKSLCKLLVIDGEAFLPYLLELYAQSILAGDRVRAALSQLHRGEELALLPLGEIRQQHLAHRGAVGRQPGALREAEVDLVLPAAEAARSVDVHDLRAVEHGEICLLYTSPSP